MELFAKKQRTFIQELSHLVDQEVAIAGWVATKRHHGKVVFLDLEDSTAKIQTVTTASQEFFDQTTTVKEQSAIIALGTVVKRPPNMVNDGLNGAYELQLTHFEVLSPAKDFPWGSQSSEGVNEELRMKYRYLDIRTGKIKTNLKLRSAILHFIRNWLHDSGFTEVETPFITKGTPEGAREYVVPSRLHAGQFYALPQSPQQFKQLLMVGGIDRYFQIVRCFRDEDPRGDRQPEFTQVDLEMSFIDREDILQLVEKLYIELIQTITPEKQIQAIPFPRLTYAEAMEKYGTDKPDLRKDKSNPNELAFCWIIDIPMFEYSETEKKLVAMHHLFTRPKPGDETLLDSDPQKALSWSYDLVLNGYEAGGGSIRIHEIELQKKIFTLLGISEEEAQLRFGHMLEAFSYGVPPHGGMAPGLDRLVMLLTGEPNIREVIAFPKTGDGRDLMMDAPAPLSEQQLKELHIKINDTTKP